MQCYQHTLLHFYLTEQLKSKTKKMWQFYNQSYVDLSFTSTYTKQINANLICTYVRTYVPFLGELSTPGESPPLSAVLTAPKRNFVSSSSSELDTGDRCCLFDIKLFYFRLRCTVLIWCLLSSTRMLDWFFSVQLFKK